MEGITTAEMMHRTGATLHQLRYWDKTGLVVPSVRQTDGRSGRRRFYSLEDVRRVEQIIALLENAYSLQEIRKIFKAAEKAKVSV